MDTVCRTRNSQVMSTLCQNLKHNYECQMFCDVTITTNQSATDNHQSVECHKLILLSSSPYFKSLLGPKYDQINIIDVSPVNINVVKEIIGYMYNGECLLHHSTFIETLETSVAWKLPLLTEECFTYMRKSKNMENVCRFYELSLKHQNIDAIYDMSNYIREHLNELSEGNHLVQLSLKAFCEIIKSDEVNVETEDVICTTVISLIEKAHSDEDISRCLKLIRYEHLTSDFLFDVIKHTVMDNEPQKSYLKNAHKYQCNKDGVQPESTARFWGPRQRFVYINKKKMICEFVGRKRRPLIAAPDWVDIGTSLYTRGSTILFVSAFTDKPQYARNMALVSLSVPYYVKTLPNLPEHIHCPGVVNTGTHIYIMGGLRYEDGTRHRSKTVDRLCMMSNDWEACPPLLEAVAQPVTLLHNQYLFVMGSYFVEEYYSNKVQRYNIETSEWTFISDLPFGVFNLRASAVVYKNRLTVVSSEHLMSYEQESDTWSVKEYEDLGWEPTALIVDRKLCTCIKRNGICSLISYDEEDNMWKDKIGRISCMSDTRYGFMV